MAAFFVLIAALNGLVSVAAGAYGRHGPFDAYAREMFSIASHYQLSHALALIGVAWLSSRVNRDRWLVAVAGAAFALGILLFSGSLYWLAISGDPPFSGSAPAGGWLLMLGWIAIIVLAVRNFRSL